MKEGFIFNSQNLIREVGNKQASKRPAETAQSVNDYLADLTASRGRKTMGSVSAMPGLRKIGCGIIVKKNLVLGGLWRRARW